MNNFDDQHEIDAELDELFGEKTFTKPTRIIEMEESLADSSVNLSPKKRFNPKEFPSDLLKGYLSKDMMHTSEANKLRKELNSKLDFDFDLPAMENKTIGDRLEYVAKQLNVTNTHIAFLSYLSAMTVLNAKQDKIRYGNLRALDNLYKTAQSLKINWTWLLTGIVPSQQKIQYESVEQDGEKILQVINSQLPYSETETARKVFERLNDVGKLEAMRMRVAKRTTVNKQIAKENTNSKQNTQNNSNSTINTVNHVNNYYQSTIKDENNSTLEQPISTEAGEVTSVQAVQHQANLAKTLSEDVLPMFDFETIGYPMLNEVIPNVFKSIEFTDSGMIYQLQRRKTDNLYLVTVDSDVSAPDIKKGDVAIIDTKQNQFMVDGFYAFIHHNRFFVATVTLERDGRYSVIRNRQKDTFTLDEINADFQIIGRAIKLIKLDIQSL